MNFNYLLYYLSQIKILFFQAQIVFLDQKRNYSSVSQIYYMLNYLNMKIPYLNKFLIVMNIALHLIV